MRQLLAAASRSNVVTFQSSGFFQFGDFGDYGNFGGCRFAATSSYVLSDHLPSTASAVRQVGINRSPGADPPIGPKEEDGPGVTAATSLRLSSGPDSRRVRWPDRLGSGLAALAEETREFPDSTGSLDSCTVWGADADRSKLRGATPSWWRTRRVSKDWNPIRLLTSQNS